MASVAPAGCPECGTEVAPGLLSCPGCHRLLHAETLRQLADEGERALRDGHAAAAVASWQRALELLPPGSRQREVLAAKIAACGPQAVQAPAAPERPAWVRRAGPLGAVAFLLWKLKTVLAFVLGQAKLLAFGLGKGGTLLTMLLSVGVYWTAWGWTFALAIVVGIYVHEIGHVAALQARGVKAQAPMFVPGLGAFVRHPPLHDPAAEARVALAGPLWGLGAVAAAFAVLLATGGGVWAGVVEWTARINLLNLTPIPPLDGGPLFRGLSPLQRWLFVAAAGALLLLTQERFLWLPLGVGAVRALAQDGAREPDWPLLAQALFVLGALAAASTIPVPLPRPA